LSRAATITDAESHLALRFLRERAGLTRRQVAELASAEGRAVSADYLAKCEADPAKVAVRVARKPTPETLQALLNALGSSPEEWRRVLTTRPWTGLPVTEGAEWDDDPAAGLTRELTLVSRAFHLASPDMRARFVELAEQALAQAREQA
jgi:transcriptional regulator with XRE-family HTH domain